MTDEYSIENQTKKLNEKRNGSCFESACAKMDEQNVENIKQEKKENKDLISSIDSMRESHQKVLDSGNRRLIKKSENDIKKFLESNTEKFNSVMENDKDMKNGFLNSVKKFEELEQNSKGESKKLYTDMISEVRGKLSTVVGTVLATHPLLSTGARILGFMGIAIASIRKGRKERISAAKEQLGIIKEQVTVGENALTKIASSNESIEAMRKDNSDAITDEKNRMERERGSVSVGEERRFKKVEGETKSQTGLLRKILNALIAGTLIKGALGFFGKSIGGLATALGLGGAASALRRKRARGKQNTAIGGKGTGRLGRLLRVGGITTILFTVFDFLDGWNKLGDTAPIIKKFGAGVGSVVKGLATIIPTLTGLIERIIPSIGGFIDYFLSIFNINSNFRETFSNFSENLTKKVSKFINDIGDGIGGFVFDVKTTVVNFFKRIGSAAKEKFMSAKATIENIKPMEIARSVRDAIVEKLFGLIQGVMSFFGDIIDDVVIAINEKSSVLGFGGFFEEDAKEIKKRRREQNITSRLSGTHTTNGQRLSELTSSNDASLTQTNHNNSANTQINQNQTIISGTSKNATNPRNLPLSVGVQP